MGTNPWNNGSDPMLKTFQLDKCRIIFNSAEGEPRAGGPGIAPKPVERLPRGTQVVLEIHLASVKVTRNRH